MHSESKWLGTPDGRAVVEEAKGVPLFNKDAASTLSSFKADVLRPSGFWRGMDEPAKVEHMLAVAEQDLASGVHVSFLLSRISLCVH